MLQLQITTDYAIRIIGYIYSKGEQLAQTMDIAEETGITYPYTMKIIHRLKTAGLIKSRRGPKGGYTLGREAEEITLYDIVLVMEGEIYINRCLQPDEYCSRNATKNCNINKTLLSVQKDIIGVLKSKRICDVWDMENDDKRI